MYDLVTIRMIKRFCKAKSPNPTFPTCVDMGEETFRKQINSGRCNCPQLAREAIADVMPAPSEGLGK